MTFENYLDVDVFVKNSLDVEDDDNFDFDVDGDVEGRITMRELDTMRPLTRVKTGHCFRTNLLHGTMQITFMFKISKSLNL